MAEFYVEKNANDTGAHLVHSSTCSSMPPKESMHYLGAFSNATAPVNKALNRFVRVSSCPQCLAA